MFAAFMQTFRLGLKSLMLQKMRSSLAALGIFIGTTTVIWLVAMGEGVSYQAQQQILELGANNIIVRSIEPKTVSSGDKNRVKSYGLLRADYQRFLSNIPSIVRAVPIRELRREFAAKGRVLNANLVGCAIEHFDLNRLEIARGRWINDQDGRENVIVLADGTAKRLFPYENPIGQKVRVESDVYTVIGQTKARSASAAIGGSLEARDYSFDAYIPLETFRQRVGDQIMTRTGEGFNFKGEIIELTQITLTIDDIAMVDETVAILERLLRKYHEQEDYAVVVPKELLRQAERTRSMFNVMLVIIAGISLLVGGIGIMNIMLATVTERTREIGIRRAVGAGQRAVLAQFLAEASLLSAIGGVIGLLAGVAGALAVEAVFGFAVAFSPLIAALAVCISVAIGIGFGLFPAWKAARMDPVEALRT
jgi:putative ABC transport system permease protein